jgi:hypothetical protein
MNNKPTDPVHFRLSNEDKLNLKCKAKLSRSDVSSYVRIIFRMGELVTFIQTLKDECEGLYGNKIPPARDRDKYLKEIEKLEKQQRELWQNLQMNDTQRKIS